jgi:hypothetical protein
MVNTSDEDCRVGTIMYRILIFLMALLVTSCGAAVSTGVPATTTSPPETTGAPATARGDEVVAVWTRSGGFAGITDKMTVYGDGRLVLEPDNGATRTVQGDAAAVQALHELVVASDWQSLDKSYGTQFPDAFAYTIVAGGKTVETFDGTDMPAVLSKVMEQLNQLYTMASQAGT